MNDSMSVLLLILLVAGLCAIGGGCYYAVRGIVAAGRAVRRSRDRRHAG